MPSTPIPSGQARELLLQEPPIGRGALGSGRPRGSQAGDAGEQIGGGPGAAGAGAGEGAEKVGDCVAREAQTASSPPSDEAGEEGGQRLRRRGGSMEALEPSQHAPGGGRGSSMLHPIDRAEGLAAEHAIVGGHGPMCPAAGVLEAETGR